jgi:hypothetical protein
MRCRWEAGIRPDHDEPRRDARRADGESRLTESVSTRQVRPKAERSGGEAGIRTLGRVLKPYNGLANRRLQPLGHLTADLQVYEMRCDEIRRAAVDSSSGPNGLRRVATHFSPPHTRRSCLLIAHRQPGHSHDPSTARCPARLWPAGALHRCEARRGWFADCALVSVASRHRRWHASIALRTRQDYYQRNCVRPMPISSVRSRCWRVRGRRTVRPGHRVRWRWRCIERAARGLVSGVRSRRSRGSIRETNRRLQPLGHLTADAKCT